MKIVPHIDEKTGKEVPGVFIVVPDAGGRTLHGPTTMASCEDFVRTQMKLLSPKSKSPGLGR